MDDYRTGGPNDPPGINPGLLMARNAAMLLAQIWQDPHWRSMSRDAQWLYMFLLSQPDLNHCGVISLRIGRWARAAAHTNPDIVQQAVKDLEAAKYVVCDEDSGELLVRALLRRDRVYLQPNLMRSALAALPAVESLPILRALRTEVERIIAENGDAARLNRGESPLTGQQKQPLTRMAQALHAIGGPAPTATSANGGSVNPSGNPYLGGYGDSHQLDALAGRGLDAPAPTVSWGNGGSVNPSATPSADTADQPNPSNRPAPTVTSENEGGVNPSANPLGSRGRGLGSGSEVVTVTTKDQPLEELPQNGDLATVDDQALLPLPIDTTPTPARRGTKGPFDTFWAAYPHKRDKDAARRAWDKITRGPNRVPTPVLIAAAGWYAQSREVAEGFAKYPATFLNKGSWRDFVHGLPDGSDPAQPKPAPPGKATARTQANLSVVEQLRAQEEAERHRTQITTGGTP